MFVLEFARALLDWGRLEVFRNLEGLSASPPNDKNSDLKTFDEGMALTVDERVLVCVETCDKRL